MIPAAPSSSHVGTVLHENAMCRNWVVDDSCGRGMRRLFLRKLKTELKIPVLALVDSDPYGLKILSVYMKGGATRWSGCIITCSMYCCFT